MVGRNGLGGVYTVWWWKNVRIQGQQEWSCILEGGNSVTAMGVGIGGNSRNTTPMLGMSSWFGPLLIARDDILCKWTYD